MAPHYRSGSGSAAAIARHPLHPFVAPIPIGALILAFVSDLLFLGTGNEAWLTTSYFLIAAGALSGALTAVLGVIEMTSVRRARGLRVMHAHAVLNVVVLVLAFASLIVRNGDQVVDGGVQLGTTEIAMSGAMAVLLLVSGWLGGEATYKHGVGVAQTVGADGPEGATDRDPLTPPRPGEHLVR